MASRFAKKVIKLALNLSILCGFVLLIRYGYQLFTTPQEDLLRGSIYLILGLVAWIVVIKLSRSSSRRYWLRYRGTKPGFKLTTFVVLCIVGVFAFAGVQPFVGYKDGVVSRWNTYRVERTTEAEERATRERAAEEARLEGLGVSNPSEVVEELSSNKELRTGLEVVELVNVIREEQDLSGLVWDDKLYECSLEHSRAMADSGELFHTPMSAPWAENAWGGYGTSWGADEIVESWMSSSRHRTWLLCPSLKHVAVGIVYSNNGMYASWTFWRNETHSSDWWY